MTRVVAVALVAVGLVGCGKKTLCERADDIWAECTVATTPGGTTGTGSFEVESACTEAIQECLSRCVIDAYDDEGCETVSGANNSGFLACQVDCTDAYRKGLGTGDTATP